MKNVLVTGADGFIGSHLTELLVKKGYRVKALSQYNSFNYWGWLEDINCLKEIEVLNGDVRLRNAYVIHADEVVKDADGNIVELKCSYLPETLGENPADGRKVRGVIHWVEATNALPAEFRVYDRLFSVANPAAEDDFLTVVNPASLVIKQGLVEPSLQNAKAEQAYQFEREGYYCADSKDSAADKLVFNRTVGLRDSWGKEEE